MLPRIMSREEWLSIYGPLGAQEFLHCLMDCGHARHPGYGLIDTITGDIIEISQPRPDAQQALNGNTNGMETTELDPSEMIRAHAQHIFEQQQAGRPIPMLYDSNSESDSWSP